MIGYPTEGWFDEHPDASGNVRDGMDQGLRQVAGVHGTPLTTQE